MPALAWTWVGIYNAALVVTTCGVCRLYGLRRRRAGKPVTPRQTVFVMLATIAVVFPALCLPALWNVAWKQPWSESLVLAVGLAAVSATPLAVFLVTARLTRLAVSVQKRTQG